MKSPRVSRRRGVVLTLQGQKKLQNARRQAEIQANFGDRYTLEELSERTGLSLNTLTKVLEAQSPVDRQTLNCCFAAFDVQLERHDYRRPDAQETINQSLVIDPPHATLQNRSQNRTDWGEATDVSTFYGRTEELSQLGQWIVQDRCRLVAVLGMGGIGKTALSVKLAHQIQAEFECVIWRSLRNAPPLEILLADWVSFLSNQRDTQGNLSQLIHYLRISRCLLILDNGETILQAGLTGQYRAGYEAYGEVLEG